ncbi:MAG: DUF6364 family protein [Spirochaetaceae bacterium]
MNITLSADEDLVENAREYARRHGTSLNQMVRDYLRTLTAAETREEAAEAFEAVARSMAGDSGGGSRGGSPWAGREALYREGLQRAPGNRTPSRGTPGE